MSNPRSVQETVRTHEALGVRNFRHPPIHMPALVLHHAETILSTSHPYRFSGAIPTVVEGPFTGVTIVLVRDNHLGYEVTLHILPRNDAGRTREVTGKTAQQCLAVDVNINVAIGT